MTPQFAAGSVWLLWEWPFLRGIYASLHEAEDVAEVLRAEFVTRGAFVHAVNVRVEEREVLQGTSEGPSASRSLVRALADRIAERWGLVSARDAQAGEMFEVERYLVMPYNGAPAFPAFQFGPDGRPTDDFVSVLAHLRDAGWDDIAIATWFATPTESLNGLAPADALAKRPDAVASAARTATRA